MKPNCAGRSIEGVKQWVTVEARDAAVAAERERQLQGVHSAGVLQWIAVEAALPDDDITVLCWLSETCEWFAGWHEVDGWHDAAIGGPIVGVTHWADPDGPGTSASYADDRQRTRELLAELLGPVTLTRDDTGDWAEMEEPAARVALAGSTPLTVVAGARNLRCRRIQIRRG